MKDILKVLGLFFGSALFITLVMVFIGWNPWGLK
jgi:hypothetical protein